MGTVGLPKALQAQEDYHSPPVINIEADMSMPIVRQLKEKKYKCTCCGQSWDSQKSRFVKSDSPIYQNNNGFTTICKDCRDEYVRKLTLLYSGNYIKAIEHFCKMFDIVFVLDVVADSVPKSSNQSKISSYLSNRNLGQTSFRVGKTYTDGLIAEAYGRRDEVIEEFEEIKGTTTRVKTKTIKFFGTGFTEDEYIFLQDEYDDWITRHECQTKAQEEVFKRLCYTQLERWRAIKEGKPTKDIDSTFQNLLDTGNLKPKQTNTNSLAQNKSFGELIAVWENEKPIPEPSEDFKDVDGIAKYISVFFLGHLCKMVGLKNKFSRMYEAEMEQYTVQRPEYEEDTEAIFDAVFGGHLEKDIDEEGLVQDTSLLEEGV